MEEKNFRFLCGIILYLMACFGTIGNAISFVTWRVGKRCKHLPGSRYLTALALSDTFVLCVSASKYATDLIFEINVWDLNDVFCKLFHTTWHFFFLVSSWIVVCVTLKRTVAVCQPLQSAVRKSPRREVIVVCVIVTVGLLVNLPFTFGAKLMFKNNIPASTLNLTLNSSYTQQGNDSKILVLSEKKTCQAEPTSFYYRHETAYHNWFIDFGLLYSAPTCILALGNAVIIWTLCRRHTLGQEFWIHNQEGVSGSMTARVVALSLVQCLTYGPFSIAAIIPGALPEVKAVDNLNFEERLPIILSLVWYVNNCVNFLLYNLFGQAFRQDCMGMLKAVFSRCKVESSDDNAGLSQIALVNQRCN